MLLGEKLSNKIFRLAFSIQCKLFVGSDSVLEILRILIKTETVYMHD